MNRWHKMLDYNLILDELIEYLFSKDLKEEGYSLFPMLTPSEIEKSFDLILEMKDLINIYDYFPFSHDYGIKLLLEKLKKRYELTPSDALAILNECKVAKEIRIKLNSFRNDKANIKNLEEIMKEVFPHSYIYDLIDSILDDYANFKPTASKVYEKLTEEKIQLEAKVDGILNNLRTKYSGNLIDNNVYLKDNKKTLLFNTSFKNKVKGDVIAYSSSNKGAFIEPQEIKTFNSEILLIINKLKEEEKKLLKKITEVVMKDYNTLLKNQELYRILDLIYAKAKFSIKYNCNKVNLSSKPSYILNNIRHPLIKENVVPISITFDKESTYLITGPNTGGKTAALKSFGLMVLLTRMGILAPLDASSQIYPIGDIYVDIGDMQSITASLSTFSGHIKNIIEIIKYAKEGDLVILDELGSGTDPIEGSAIAISIIEYFKEKNIKLILTSHYPDIKKYAINTNWIKCASVSFNEKTLKPEYYLNEDILGKSNAFIIAENLGLNKNILNKAKSVIKNLKTKEQITLEALDTKKEQIIKDEQILKEKEKDLKDYEITQKEKYLEMINDLNKKYLENKKELEREIEDLKEELRLTIKDVEEKSKEHVLASAKEKLSKKVKTKTLNENLQIGDTVFVIPYDTKGVIENINKNKYSVTIGNMSFDFTKDELSLVKEKEPKIKKTIKKSNYTPIKRTYVTDLDLRGFRYEEVEDTLMHTFSELLLSNQKELRIITGHGTGVVRKAVIGYLKKNKQVKSYRFGDQHEGSTGCIVVTLK